MRHSLTDLARCLWGDEYGPTPDCDAQWQHEESYFTELPTFAGPDEILTMLRTLCPHLVDGYLPVRVRNPSERGRNTDGAPPNAGCGTSEDQRGTQPQSR
ncbi:hypothetical protein ACIRYZ_25550 [Kitasatospora sp. NPDC101155]|uniref:hypothetical protein n=1 Tax=Kitasatospora sp. NPDC101155 TaxID=3364097 RepID=UPI00382935BC